MTITKQDVELRVERINELLAATDTNRRIRFSGRNDYHVIEETCAQDMYSAYGEPYVAGTKRECYNYVCAMLKAFDLLCREG